MYVLALGVLLTTIAIITSAFQLRELRDAYRTNIYLQVYYTTRGKDNAALRLVAYMDYRHSQMRAITTWVGGLYGILLILSALIGQYGSYLWIAALTAVALQTLMVIDAFLTRNVRGHILTTTTMNEEQ